MKPTVTVTRGGDHGSSLAKSLESLRKYQVHVGIPAGTTARERMVDIIQIAAKSTGKRKQRLLSLAAQNTLSNAELMYIHTNGSPINNIPARPVIEPAIKQKENLSLITSELEKAAQAALEGHSDVMLRYLNRAGLLASGLVKKWFTDPRNHWAPNSPATIREKGSSRPLIDSGELRKSITYWVSEE